MGNKLGAISLVYLRNVLRHVSDNSIPASKIHTFFFIIYILTGKKKLLKWLAQIVVLFSLLYLVLYF